MELLMATSHHHVRRLAVFYPFSDFHNPQCGAGVRVNQMVRLISGYVDEIRVMQRWNKASYSKGNVRLESVEVNDETFVARSVEKGIRLIFDKLINRNHKDETGYLRRFLEPYLFPEFKKSVNDLVAWADAVLLEYPFWGSVVEAACRQNNVPLILTDHDFLTDHIHHNPVVQWGVRQLEVTSLKKARHVVAVTQHDAQVFRNHGISCQVIKNATDFLFWKQDFPVNPRSFLKKKGVEPVAKFL